MKITFQSSCIISYEIDLGSPSSVLPLICSIFHITGLCFSVLNEVFLFYPISQTRWCVPQITVVFHSEVSVLFEGRNLRLRRTLVLMALEAKRETLLREAMQLTKPNIVPNFFHSQFQWLIQINAPGSIFSQTESNQNQLPND